MGYKRLTLREALASNQLEDFVRQEEARGVELANGSDLERALALLITQRRSEDRSFTAAADQKIDHSRWRLRKSSARRKPTPGMRKAASMKRTG